MRSIYSNNHPKRQWAANTIPPISSSRTIPHSTHSPLLRFTPAHDTSNATLATQSGSLYTTPHAHGYSVTLVLYSTGRQAWHAWREGDTGEEIEFDPVAIRCDFAEHDSLTDWAEDYFSGDNWRDNVNCDYDADDDEVDEKIREYIQDRGQLIEFSGGIIVSNF